MRHQAGVALVVPLAGCLLGVTVVTPRPVLDGEPEVLAPAGNDDLPAAARGTEVVLRVPVTLPVDLDASRLTLGGGELACEAEEPTLLLCRRTIDGNEIEGRARLGAELSARTYRASSASQELVRLDFTAPVADCLLSPTTAGLDSPAVLTVLLSEAVRDGSPQVTVDDPTLQVRPRASLAGQHAFEVRGTPGVDVDGFHLTVRATDLAGNPQEGDSLCPAAARTGRWLGSGPALLGEVVVEASPSVEVDGELRVRDGAAVTVSLSTTRELDLDRSQVLLSGLRLEPDAAGTRWSATLVDPPDGPRDLDAVLYDLGGNPTRVHRKDVLRVDGTPPAGACFLSPTVAPGHEPPRFQLTVDEPLVQPPTISADGVTLELESEAPPQWVWSVRAPPGQDTAYEIHLSATDLLGSTAEDDALCPLARRSGSVRGVLPTLASPPVLEVASGPWVDEDGTPRVGDGAVVRVRLDTVATLDRQATLVQLGDQRLTWSGTSQAWELPVGTGASDGFKALRITLVDDVGNAHDEDAGSLAVVVDRTAPTLTSSGLSRTPFLDGADDGQGTVQAARLDPFTGQTVSVRVALTASEPLGPPPTWDVAPATPTGATTTHEDLAATWLLPAVPADEDGTYTFQVVLEDRVGNRSTPLPVPVTLVLDTLAPTPPDVDARGRIQVTRVPWGTADDPDPRTVVTGTASAATPGARLVFGAGTAAPLANLRAGPDGSFGPLVLAGDVRDLGVAQLDAAGNASDRVRVREVAWVATLGGRVRGSDASNPHRLVEARTGGPGRVGGVEVADAATAARPGTMVTTTSQGRWERYVVSGPPAANAAMALASDPARGEVVMFGGGELDSSIDISPTPVQGTWRWDGHTWQAAALTGASPETRRFAAFAWEPDSQRLLVHGGEGPNDDLDDTWAWDGDAWSLVAEGGGPGTLALLATDPERGELVAYDPETDRAWTWADEAWLPRAAGVLGDAPRRAVELVFDPVTRSLLLLVVRPADPWERQTWRRSGHTWTQVHTGAATDGNAVFARTDWSRGRAVQLRGDTPSWTGTTWEPGPGPLTSIDIFYAYTYDDARGVLVGVGGWTPFAIAPVRELRGGSWVGVTPSTHAPPSSFKHGLATSPSRGEVVAFIGHLGSAETWTFGRDGWSGGPWPVQPTERSGPLMALLPGGEETLLVGGLNERAVNGQLDVATSTWSWADGAWTEVIDPSPPDLDASTTGATMTLAPGGQTVLVYGGAYTRQSPPVSQVWAHDHWEAWWPPPALPMLYAHVAFHHPPSGATILVGGVERTFTDGTLSDNVWFLEADGSLRVEEGPRPPARREAAIAWDPIAGRAILFGGRESNDRLLSDTWTWDGVRWAEADAPGPPALFHHEMAWSPTWGRVVLYGGSNGDRSTNATWTWDSGVHDRPRQQLDLDVSASGLPETALEALTARWRVGGVAYEDDTATPGAALHVWDVRAWSEVDAVAAPPDAPEETCWSLRRDDGVPGAPSCAVETDALRLDRLVVGTSTRRLHLAVRPLADAGAGDPVDRSPARLATEHLEVRLDHRLAPFTLRCGDGDGDGDGRCDGVDPCVGSAADDGDEDGVCDDLDTCLGDDAIGDDDGDGVCDDLDLCLGDDATADDDGDGICGDLDTCLGDDATGDDDLDGVCDDRDLCLGDDATGDEDEDLLCDDRDPCFGDDATGDADVDGVCDDRDLCLGDDATDDDDLDGICGDRDRCPGDDATQDPDEDGLCGVLDLCFGAEATGDLDRDGVCADRDPCLGPGTLDTDGDGLCDGTSPLEDWTFDGCPDSWDLREPWSCGVVPTTPAAAAGLGVLATGLDGPHGENFSWNVAGSGAISPDLAVPAGGALVELRLWWSFEGDILDGFGADGFRLVVVPTGEVAEGPGTALPTDLATNARVNNQPAWCGDAADRGWQTAIADLTPFEGTSVRLALVMYADDQGSAPGAYVDRVRIVPLTP
ncbi:MAG: hypothetical protein H6732_06255 [Alphaproteobacteria bacterium]|nr:hypothetical protein [Alphaproteobacteria bacterium]